MEVAVENKLRYDKYKDSGIEWLGEIPEHWEVKKLKNISNVKMGQSPDSKDVNDNKLGIPFLQGNAEFGFINPIAKLWCTTPNKVSNPNDILLSVRAPVGALNVSDKAYGIGRGLCAITPVYIINNYLYKLLEISDKVLNKLGTGSTFNAISLTNVLNFYLPLPPPPEQHVIANFLDDKCSKIDAAVEIKQKQIALLKERRQIAIHQAVTRGLDKNVPLKDSGVEWIGEIPEHWQVKRLKHLYTDTFSGGTPSTEVLKFWDGGISWISSADVKTSYLSKSLRSISELGLKHSSANMAKKGSVIIVTRSGILQHTLPIAILMKDMAINQDIKSFVLKEELIVSNYLLCYIQGKNNEILVETRKQGATVESIEMEDFANLIIPLPELEEQLLIIEHIKRITLKIDTAISIKQQEIEKLKEYKTSLINSVVTGKIKVSGAN